MPKYFSFKVCGYYLYFTSHCVVECMYAHASDEELTEAGSAKFVVYGSSRMINRGKLMEREASQIQKFIAENYETMYLVWRTMSQNGFYQDK